MRLRAAAGIVVAALMGSLLLPAGPAVAEAPPTAPQLDLAASVTPTSGDVVLAWSGVPGATGYTVDVALDAGFTSTVETANTPALRWAPLTALATTLPRTYYWRVRAYGTSPSDWSDASTSDTSQFDRDALAAPVLLSPGTSTALATVDYPSPLVFSWQPVVGATGYTLEYTTDDSFSSPVSVSTTAATYTPKQLLSRGSTWYWRVTATLGISGVTPASVVRSFTIGWPGSAPTLSWPPADSTMSDVDFRWEPVTGASYYLLDLATSPDFATGSRILDGQKVVGTRYARDTALDNATYWWRVTAYDPAGKPGQTSAVRQFRRSWGAQPEAQITDPDIVGAADVTSAYPVPTYVDADHAVPSSADAASPAVVPVDKLELSWSPLPRATYYEVEVVAAGEDFFGAPTNKRLTCYTAATSATVVATYSTAGASSPDRLKYAGACLAKQSAIELVPGGTTYKWRVRAVDLPSASTGTFQVSGAGKLTSAWSDPQLTGVPQQQAYFQVAAAGSTGSDPATLTAPAYDAQLHQPPTLRWTPVTGATSYRVDLALDASFSSGVATFTTPQPLLRINGALADNSTADAYYWKVAACTTPTACGTAALSRFKKVSTPLSMDPPLVDIAGNTVALSWAPPSLDPAGYDGGSRGYETQVSTTSDFASVLWTAKTDQPFVDTQDATRKLDNNTYYTRTRALNAAGTPLSWSPVKSFTKSMPPTGINAVAASGTASALSWTPSSSVASYEVRYWQDGATASNNPQVTALQDSATTVTGLNPGNYNWQVRVKDAFGTGNPLWSDAGTFQITAPQASLVTGAGSVLRLSDRLLVWNAVPGVARYRVQTATNAAFSAGLLSTDTVQTRYAPTASLVFGTQYYWRVQGISSANKVVSTSEARPFTVVTVPTAPTLGTLTSTSTSVSATWTVQTGTAAGSPAQPTYVVRHRVTGSGDSWVTYVTSAGATNLTATGLDLGTSYDFQLAARNGEGQSPWSALKAKATSAVPGAPTNVVAVYASGSLQVSWTAPAAAGASPVTSYQVRYRVDGGPLSTPQTTKTSSITIPGITAGGSYTVEVVALNAVGAGPAGIGTVTVHAAPGAPTGVSGLAGDRSAKVAWSVPTNDGGSALTGFVVERRSLSGSTWSAWSTAATTAASTRSVTLTGLADGTTYEVRVRARNGFGTSAPSGAARVSLPGKPGKVTGLKAVAKRAKVVLTWRPATANGLAVSGYRLTYKLKGTSWKPLTNRTGTKFVWRKAKAGKVYYFRVAAVNAKGVGPQSTAVKVQAR